jgi:hypothetical protein
VATTRERHRAIFVPIWNHE